MPGVVDSGRTAAVGWSCDASINRRLTQGEPAVAVKCMC
jgi:hypothetical protein